jgi:hypothetical protein
VGLSRLREETHPAMVEEDQRRLAWSSSLYGIDEAIRQISVCKNSAQHRTGEILLLRTLE